jgi:hypothetical protein
MRLTKVEALFLAKVLFHYEQTRSLVESSTITERVRNLRGRLNDFILDVEDDVDECDHECSDDCHVSEERVRLKSKPNGSLIMDDEDEDEVYEDVAKEAEDDSSLPNVEETISASVLHALPVVKTDNSQSLEFEHVEGDQVDVVLDGYTEYEDVGFVRRHGRSIDLYVNHDWITVNVPKFPKQWTKLLTVDTTYRLQGRS